MQQNIRGATLIYEFLSGIVARRMSAKSIDGPIRIAQLSGEAAREGAYTFINLMAAVSLNLAIINLLPIPILDGGVILLLLFEMLIRRDLSVPVKEAVFKFGFVFLLMVMVFVDLQRHRQDAALRVRMHPGQAGSPTEWVSRQSPGTAEIWL